MELPKTRAEAKAIGSPRYFTGRLCKHGHIAPRRTINRSCLTCAITARSVYRNTSTGKLKNKEAFQRWYAAPENKARCVENATNWRTTPKGRACNRANTRARQVRKLQACPMWADMQKMKQIYEQARRLSDIIGIEYEVDHVVPLRNPHVCGLHVPVNLEIIPAWQNKLKHNKFEVK